MNPETKKKLQKAFNTGASIFNDVKNDVQQSLNNDNTNPNRISDGKAKPAKTIDGQFHTVDDDSSDESDTQSSHVELDQTDIEYIKVIPKDLNTKNYAHAISSAYLAYTDAPKSNYISQLMGYISILDLTSKAKQSPKAFNPSANYSKIAKQAKLNCLMLVDMLIKSSK